MLKKDFSIHYHSISFTAEGYHHDYKVFNTRHFIFGENPPPFSVETRIRKDGIALETAEYFTLSLEGVNSVAKTILEESEPGVFALPEIHIAIEDTDSKLYCCLLV